MWNTYLVYENMKCSLHNLIYYKCIPVGYKENKPISWWERSCSICQQMTLVNIIYKELGLSHDHDDTPMHTMIMNWYVCGMTKGTACMWYD